MEEDLRPEEALVADIDVELLLADGVDARVLLNPLGGVGVVLVELLDEVGADVAEALLQQNNMDGGHVQSCCGNMQHCPLG